LIKFWYGFALYSGVNGSRSSSKTTEIYTHITTKGFDQIKNPLDNLDILNTTCDKQSKKYVCAITLKTDYSYSIFVMSILEKSVQSIYKIYTQLYGVYTNVASNLKKDTTNHKIEDYD